MSRLLTTLRSRGAGGGGGGSGVVVEAISQGTVNSATLTFDLPTGTQAGDLVVVFMRYGGAYAGTMAMASGWTEVTREGSSFGEQNVARRVIEAGDGPTAAHTIPGARAVAWTAYRISGVATSEPSFVEGISGGTTNLTATWGSALNLWIGAFSSRRTDNTLTPPAGYGDTTTQVTAEASTSINDCRLSTARQITETGTLAQGNWNVTGTTNATMRSTVVIRPAA